MNHLFSGRSVAIVGSSPTILDRQQGAEIDAHDVVMRINLHGIHDRPECLGSRTDVRFIRGKCTLETCPNIKEQIDCSVIVNGKRNQWLEEYLDIPVVFSKIKLTSWLQANHPELLVGLNMRRKHYTWKTTTGSNALALALEYKASRITLYGFTFSADQRDDTINEDGTLGRYGSMVGYHPEPEEEVTLLLRMMQHYPIFADNAITRNRHDEPACNHQGV